MIEAPAFSSEAALSDSRLYKVPRLLVIQSVFESIHTGRLRYKPVPLSELAIESRRRVNCKDQLRDKPVAHREQVPDALRISAAADARGPTVADRAPAQFAVRNFIVRLMSQGSEIRLAKFTLDIDR